MSDYKIPSLKEIVKSRKEIFEQQEKYDYIRVRSEIRKYFSFNINPEGLKTKLDFYEIENLIG